MTEMFLKSAALGLAFIGIMLGLSLLAVCNVCFSPYSQHLYSIIGIIFVVALSLYGFICGQFIQKYYTLAHRDQLTNLWNRRYFYAKLSKEVDHFKQTKVPLCIALIDIDDFKIINDIHGHFVGDVVLKEVATILINSTRAVDTVVRLGGDEFAIILADTNIEAASAVAERIRETIANSNDCCKTTISVGVLLIQPEIEIKVDQILKLVDETLYKAKTTKNLVVATIHS